MSTKLLTLFTSALFLFIGCSSGLGFRTTYTQDNGITESTQGIHADFTLDTPK